MAALEIPDDWKPTAANINALPDPLRTWIMMLETHCDPAHTLQENAALRDQVAQLLALLELQRRSDPRHEKAGRPAKETTGLSLRRGRGTAPGRLGG